MQIGRFHILDGKIMTRSHPISKYRNIGTFLWSRKRIYCYAFKYGKHNRDDCKIIFLKYEKC